MTTAQLAEVIGVDVRQLDNAIAVAARDVIPPGRRGRSRVIPDDVAELLAIAFVLRRDLGAGLRQAVGFARRLQTAEGRALQLGTLTTLTLDLSRLREVLRAATADVIAASPPARRGRPPGKKKRGARLTADAPIVGW